MNLKKGIKMGITLAVIGSLTLLAGCANKKEDVNKKSEVDKPTVAVSIVPEKTFVEAVCGDLVNVVVLIPPGNSPENYEPTPKEMTEFNEAIAYFAIGVPTEEANILPLASDLDQLKIVKLNEVVAEVYPELEIAPGERDPHIWLSPKRVKVMINVIAEEMGKIDPDHKEQFTENGKKYLEQLDTLDQNLKIAVDAASTKKFIVFHPSLGYIANDYGLTMYSLEKNGKEATANQLEEIIDFAKKENIKALFYQAEISSKQADSFAQEIGGKTVLLEPLSGDYIENLMKMVKLITEVN